MQMAVLVHDCCWHSYMDKEDCCQCNGRRPASGGKHNCSSHAGASVYGIPCDALQQAS